MKVYVNNENVKLHNQKKPAFYLSKKLALIPQQESFTSESHLGPFSLITSKHIRTRSY